MLYLLLPLLYYSHPRLAGYGGPQLFQQSRMRRRVDPCRRVDQDPDDRLVPQSDHLARIDTLQQPPSLFEPIADWTELLMPDDLLSGESILAYIRGVQLVPPIFRPSRDPAMYHT